MLKYLPSCYSALSFLRAHCSYILLKKNYFKAFSLFFSLKNIFYFSLFFLFFPSSLFRPAVPLLLFTFVFFFFSLSKIDLPVAPHLKLSHDLDLNQWSYFPSNFFFSVGFNGGSRWLGLSRRPGDPLNPANPPASDPPPPDPKTPTVGRGFRRS